MYPKFPVEKFSQVPGPDSGSREGAALVELGPGERLARSRVRRALLFLVGVALLRGALGSLSTALVLVGVLLYCGESLRVRRDRVYLDRGHPLLALSAAESLLSEGPEGPRSFRHHMVMVDALVALGRIDEAREDLHALAVADLTPEQVHPWTLREAAQLWMRGEAEAAIECVDRAAREMEGSEGEEAREAEELLRALAALLRSQLGRVEEAARRFRGLCLERLPRREWGWILLQQARLEELREEGHPRDCLALAEQALREHGPGGEAALEAHWTLAHHLTWVQARYPASLEVLERVLLEARLLDHPLLPDCLGLAGALAEITGDLHRSSLLGRELEERAASGAGPSIRFPLFDLRLREGRVEEAAAVLEVSSRGTGRSRLGGFEAAAREERRLLLAHVRGEGLEAALEGHEAFSLEGLPASWRARLLQSRVFAALALGRPPGSLLARAEAAHRAQPGFPRGRLAELAVRRSSGEEGAGLRTLQGELLPFTRFGFPRLWVPWGELLEDREVHGPGA